MTATTTGTRRLRHSGDARQTSITEPIAAGCALLVCVAARLPHHLLEATGVRGWAFSLVVVVAFVNGARAVARAPFTFARSSSASAWARTELKETLVTVTFGAVLVLPLYALVRATPLWWLFAWILFAAVTVIGVMAAPLTARAQFGPLSPTSPLLADRIRTLGRRAGVEISDGATGGVAVAGKAGSDRCNAYVVGLGPTRRVVLEHSVTEWPPEVVDQVVAHEIGHWRLGHTARRLPAIVAQLATFAFAGWLLTRPVLLDWAGVAGLGDPRSYALFLLLTPALALPARCLLAWRDRAQERAADEFALSLLRAPEHFTAMLDRAADEGGAPRQLAPWRRLTASHPSIDERALLCTRFASTA